MVSFHVSAILTRIPEDAVRIEPFVLIARPKTLIACFAFTIVILEARTLAVARKSGQGDTWEVDPIGNGENMKKPDSSTLGAAASVAVVVAFTMLRNARK